MVQIGDREDEEKKFTSIPKEQNLGTITLNEALDLFLLPKDLGAYQDEKVTVANGRYGPYIKHGKQYISLPKGAEPTAVDLQQAIELIDEKQEADKPIALHDDLPVQKGVGRFGPYLKWNGIFINVNKRYNFDNLSDKDIFDLIEEKKKKEREKVIHHWEEEGICLEKARWGRFNLIKGKTKIELPKDHDVANMTLLQAKEIFNKKK